MGVVLGLVFASCGGFGGRGESRWIGGEGRRVKHASPIHRVHLPSVIRERGFIAVSPPPFFFFLLLVLEVDTDLRNEAEIVVIMGLGML